MQTLGNLQLLGSRIELQLTMKCRNTLPLCMHANKDWQGIAQGLPSPHNRWGSNNSPTGTFLHGRAGMKQCTCKCFFYRVNIDLLTNHTFCFVKHYSSNQMRMQGISTGCPLSLPTSGFQSLSQGVRIQYFLSLFLSKSSYMSSKEEEPPCLMVLQFFVTGCGTKYSYQLLCLQNFEGNIGHSKACPFLFLPLFTLLGGVFMRYFPSFMSELIESFSVKNW